MSTGDAGEACAVPLTACGASCSDLQSDPLNCGGCGIACDTAHAEVCSQGKCALACGGGTSKCGSACFDLQSDAKNCGACGTSCKQGEQCANGTCQTACGAGLSLCGAKNGSQACVDSQSDDQNCGKCGNVCGSNNACVAGSCVANLATIGAQPLQDQCTTYGGSSKAFVDAAHGLHAVMICTSGVVSYTGSKSGGIGFSKPVDIGLKSMIDATVHVSNDGKIHVLALASGTNALWYVFSTDGGSTWSKPETFDDGVGSFGLSIASYKGDVWFGAAKGAAGHVWRHVNGVPTLATIGTNQFVPNRLVVDPSSGTLWFAGDNGSVFIASSKDGGATFSAPVATNIGQYYTDTAFANGKLVFAGYQPHMDVVDPANPTVPVTTNGFDTVTSSFPRRIAVDGAGNAYLAAQVSTDIVLQRVLANATSIESKRVLGAGTSPSIAATDKAAFVVFTQGAQVMATVQAY